MGANYSGSEMNIEIVVLLFIALSTLAWLIDSLRRDRKK